MKLNKLVKTNKIVLILHVLLSLIIVMTKSNAYAMINPLSQCVASDDLGGSNVETLYVAPNDVGCQNLCAEECSKYLGGLTGSQQINMALFQDDINADIISQCLIQCQNGVQYSPAYIRYYNIDSTTGLQTNIIGIESNNKGPISRVCTNVQSYPITQTAIDVLSGDQFTISLGGDQDNKVYLCGKKSIILDPLINSTDNNVWSNSQQKTISNLSNICLANSPLWQVMSSNQSIWYRVQTTNTCNWHARNYLFTDTGIWVRDNDELSIEYTGTYGIGMGALPQSIINSIIANPLLNDPSTRYNMLVSNLSYNFQNAKYAYSFLNSLEVLVPGQSPTNSKASFYVMSPEKIRSGALTDYTIQTIDDPNAVTDPNNPQWPWFGLTPSMTTSNPSQTGTYTDGRTVNIPLPDNKNCTVTCGTSVTTNCVITDSSGATDTSSNNLVNNACKYTLIPSPTTYSYTGILNGFSTSPARLSFRHRETDSSNLINYYENTSGISTSAGTCYSRIYNDNLGGLNVKINWGGCIYTNGQRLQYAIAPATTGSNQPSIPGSSWCDVYEGTNVNSCNSICRAGQSSCTLTASSAGRIYLRLAPITANYSATDPNYVYPMEAASDPSVAVQVRLQDYYSSANLFGNYEINIQNNFANGAINFSGPIIYIVGMVRTTLLGDGGNGGVLGNLYSNLISQSSFVSVIRAILVMYLAYVSMGFLIGTVELSQKEVVSRILKVTFVSMMISNSSWQFFHDTFFVFIIDAGGDLMLKLVQPLVNATNLSSLRFTNDPVSVFAIFDGPLTQLLSQQVWSKVFAIVCTSLMGIPLAILLLDGIITYLIVIGKSALAYIASIISIAFLLFLAPVFIPMMLFQFTKDMFDKWWKLLLSSMMTPVILFTCVAFFNIIIVQTIYAIFAFTVCPTCFLGIDLVVQSYCIIPIYKIMSTLFSNSNVSFFSIPTNLFSGILIFVILTHAMNSIILFATELSNMIVAGYGGETSLISHSDKAAAQIGKFGSSVKGYITNKVEQKIAEQEKKFRNRDNPRVNRTGRGGAGGGGRIRR